MLGSLARERLANSYKRASLDHPLTGILNRRGFLERCEAQLRRTVFEQQPSALLMFDVDNFKSVNDTFGHHVGDQVLLEFCRIVASWLRPNDIFGRVGGEEFGCLIPRASLCDGSDIAERIRARAEAMPLRDGGAHDWRDRQRRGRSLGGTRPEFSNVDEGCRPGALQCEGERPEPCGVRARQRRRAPAESKCRLGSAISAAIFPSDGARSIELRFRSFPLTI